MDNHSIISQQAERTAEEVAAPPPPPPHEASTYYQTVGPYMNGYIPHVDQLSRVRRLNNIELTHSRSLRLNFRDYMDNFDDHYYYGHYGPPMHHEVHHHPPPPSRHMIQGPLPPPPPPPFSPGPPVAPPCAGYPPYNYFSDENPNGCIVM